MKLATKALSALVVGAVVRSGMEIYRSMQPPEKAIELSAEDSTVGAPKSPPTGGSMPVTSRVTGGMPVANRGNTDHEPSGVTPTHSEITMEEHFRSVYDLTRSAGAEIDFRKYMDPIMTRPIGVSRAEFVRRLASSPTSAPREMLESIFERRSSEDASNATAFSVLNTQDFRFVVLRINDEYEFFAGADSSPVSIVGATWIRNIAARHHLERPTNQKIAELEPIVSEFQIAIERVRRSVAKELIDWSRSGAVGAMPVDDIVAMVGDRDGGAHVIHRRENADLDDVLKRLSQDELNAWNRWGAR
jgi:hypothetical protein